MTNRTIFLVHGAGRKPAQPALEGFWREAIAAGLKRDCPEVLEAWEQVEVRFVYFGDWSGPLHQKDYDEALDIANRRRSLDQLKALDKAKRFRRTHYERLPGKSSLGEFVADLGMPIISRLGFGRSVLEKVAPELDRYWRQDADFGRLIEDRFAEPLIAALESERDVAIVSHCVGSVVVFDTLWRLGREGPERKVSRLVTFGSPLADETVKKQLAGAKQPEATRFPNNIIAWHNLAAEDDYVCHDNTMQNDYAAMLKNRQISVIDDQPIYNLAVRFNRSNPHNAVGYLVHPRMARVLGDWLRV